MRIVDVKDRVRLAVLTLEKGTAEKRSCESVLNLQAICMLSVKRKMEELAIRHLTTLFIHK